MTESAHTHRAALRTRAGDTLTTDVFLAVRPEPGMSLLWRGAEYWVVAIEGWEYFDGAGPYPVLLVEQAPDAPSVT